jgi:hypothetical protein
MIKRLINWLSNRRAIKNARNARAYAEHHAWIHRMKTQGICLDCVGKGKADLPPWGIVHCDTCNGTGRKKYASYH